MAPDWTPLGGIAPTDLTKPRLQLHRAAQVLGAAADSLLPTAPDHSHASLSWSASQRLLMTQPLPGSTSTRVAVAPASLELIVLTDDGAASRLELDGAHIDDAYRWLEHELHRIGLLQAEATIPRSGLDLGDGPGRASSPFATDHLDAFEELARWFGNASLALGRARRDYAKASPVRCWPHHLDIAVLVPLDDGEDEDARSVGLGMTPGDDSYAEPYFYVTPWPYPGAGVSLPPLTSGAWHTEGWTGAVLTGSEIVAAGAEEQAAFIARHLDAAMVHAVALLHR